jgi:hypothetical protein
MSVRDRGYRDHRLGAASRRRVGAARRASSLAFTLSSQAAGQSNLHQTPEFTTSRLRLLQSRIGLRLSRRPKVTGNRQAQICSTLGQRGSLTVFWIEPARRVSVKVCSSDGHDKSQ